MFQTEINHFLQSFASDGLTTFMQLITASGYPAFLLLLLFILLFVVDFKKGYLLVMIFLWTAAFTYVFKEYFNMPRPFHVDNTIELLDGDLPDEAAFDFSKRGATTFWSGLPEDVLEVTRQTEGVENGFPSGHSSIAIALWAALALLFRKRWITIISIAIMILNPFSRMYLGVHFLGDVLGGITLGAIILGVFYAIVLKPDKLSTFLQKDKYDIGLNGISMLLLLGPIPLFFILSPKMYVLIAFLWSFGLGFLLLSRKGLPNSDASILDRVKRLLIAVSTFAAVGFLLSKLIELTGLTEIVWMDFIKNTIIGLALIWGSIELNIRLGWFK